MIRFILGMIIGIVTGGVGMFLLLAWLMDNKEQKLHGKGDGINETQESRSID